jgi:hypothetical protein
LGTRNLTMANDLLLTGRNMLKGKNEHSILIFATPNI